MTNKKIKILLAAFLYCTGLNIQVVQFLTGYLTLQKMLILNDQYTDNSSFTLLGEQSKPVPLKFEIPACADIYIYIYIFIP